MENKRSGAETRLEKDVKRGKDMVWLGKQGEREGRNG